MYTAELVTALKTLRRLKDGVPIDRYWQLSSSTFIYKTFLQTLRKNLHTLTIMHSTKDGRCWRKPYSYIWQLWQHILPRMEAKAYHSLFLRRIFHVTNQLILMNSRTGHSRFENTWSHCAENEDSEKGVMLNLCVNRPILDTFVRSLFDTDARYFKNMLNHYRYLYRRYKYLDTLDLL